jgi:hypothetical protein
MITISVNEAPTADADRIAVLEQSVEELTLAFERLIRQLSYARDEPGPCPCGDPECQKQAACEAEQASPCNGPNSVGGASGSGGQYL